MYDLGYIPYTVQIITPNYQWPKKKSTTILLFFEVS